VHQSVVVSLQYCVNPNGSLHREWVVELRVGCATFPSLHALGDVKGTTNVGTVQIVSHRVPEADLSSCLSKQRVVLNPWCVLLEADTSLVFLDLTTDFYLTEGLSLRFKISLLGSRLRTVSIGGTIYIIGVQASNLVIYLLFKVCTMWVINNILGDIVLAVVLSELSEQILRDQVEVLIGLESGGSSIHIPVCDTVANGKTLQVVSDVTSHVSFLVPVMDLPSEEGTVDPGIALS
jgi:hypothetical protein